MKQTTANRNEQTAANGKRWTPPRGIRLFEVLGRPDRPYAVQWRVDGTRRTKTFPTAAAQLDFARALAADAANSGTAAYRLNEDEARAWRSFRAEIGDVDLQDVLACWRRHGQPEKTAMPLAEAIEAFQAAKQAEGLVPASLAHFRPLFARFAGGIGPQVRVSAITREQVGAWIEAVPGADQTRRTAFARVRTFFRWLKTSRLIAESPCEGLKPVRLVPDEVEILTVEQGKKLFEANQDEANQDSRELCGRLALEAFAGLRFSTTQRIVPADIVMADRGIVLPAAKLKTRRRQYIDGLPDNLWEWLEWSRPAEWSMTPRQYLQAKSLAFAVAKIPHPRNALRHSFCTYHVAINKDASRTATLLCHSSPKMLYASYKGRATEQDGKAWFEIRIGKSL